MQVHNTQTLRKGGVRTGEYPQKGTWKLKNGITFLFAALPPFTTQAYQMLHIYAMHSFKRTPRTAPKLCTYYKINL